MKRLLGLSVAAGAAVLLVVAYSSAQERRDAQNKGQQKTERDARDAATQPGRDQLPQRGRNQADSQLVTWLAADGEGEIAIGKFAAERAQNSAVKEFAHKMVKNHSEFLEKLRGIAPIASTSAATAGAAGAREPARVAQDKPGTTRPEDPKRAQSKSDTAQTNPRLQDDATARRAYLDPDGGADLLRMKQEIAKLCLETVKKELDQKSSAEFDQCYIGTQIAAHLGMSDTLQVMRNFASPELRRLLEDGHKTAQQHLELAKDLMKQLESDSKNKSSKSNN